MLFFTSSDILDKRPPKLEDFFWAKAHGIMPNVFVFFKEVKEELAKVAWPSREQTIRYTILVIIVAAATGLFLGGLDYILTALTAFFINR